MKRHDRIAKYSRKNVWPPSTSVYFRDAALDAADGATLAHLLKRGTGPNALRAIRSDIGYLEAWSLACDNKPLPWPPSSALVLRFIAHHLWDPEEKAANPDHGMPEDVETMMRAGGFLRTVGPHAPSTVSRRLSTWRSVCKWRGLDGPFDAPDVSRTLRAATRASGRAPQKKSRRNVGIDLMKRLLDHLDIQCRYGWPEETASSRMRALRDRALLATTFASGGRRRSEIAGLLQGQIRVLEAEGAEGAGAPDIALKIGRTKTTDIADDATVYLSGRAALALLAWRTELGRETGPVFPAIDRWGRVGTIPMTGHSVSLILKTRLAELGLDPTEFSAHGMRAGFVTSAFKAGVPAQEIMAQTMHRSLDTLTGYFQDEDRRRGRAARLL